MKVSSEQETPAWEDAENVSLAHDGCPEHWRNDLRRSNTALNEITMGDLIKHFEPFDLASKKSNQRNKKENKLQFKNEE